MEKLYIKSRKSNPVRPPCLSFGGGRDTQKVPLTIVLLIGLTSAMIGMAVPYAFPGLFLEKTLAVDDKLAGVPDVRQSHEDGSAAASLQAVMAFYGIDRGEQAWQESIGPAEGLEETANAARAEGFEAGVEREIETDELTALVMDGVPPIVALDGKQYVVVVGTDDEGIILEDPAVFGGRTHLKTEEFIARWTDGTAVVIRNTARD